MRKRRKPKPPANAENKNGPTHRDNDKKGHTSDQAHDEPTNPPGEGQEPAAENVENNDTVEKTCAPPEERETQCDGKSGETPEQLPEELTPTSILSMRLPASELEGTETKLVRTKITVDKPPKDQFFKVHDGEDHWVPFGLLEVERASTFYLVAPGEVRDWMITEGIKAYFDTILCLVVTRHGEPRVWPLKQTDNSWHRSARDIAEMAKTRWVKLISDQTAGYYLAGEASNQSKKPA
ncbi:MAG: hypothetical protein ACI8UO_002636 [Verrucomicrobiales bacterium]|jgi:hypothetical protein